MTVRVAINGFGRIGRSVLRAAHRARRRHRVRRVNDLADAGTLAHLLKHDSVFGRFPGDVGATATASRIDGTRRSGRCAETDPAALPWDELGVDVVIESTGTLPHARRRRQAPRGRRAQGHHLRAGQGLEPADATVVLGVNFDEVYDPERHHIITNASCTTNCLAPVAKVLHEAVGIRHGLMTTIHAYTADQKLLDGPHKDLRRAPRGGGEPRAHVDRRGEGVGPGDPGARGPAARATPCACRSRPGRSSTSRSRRSARPRPRRSTPPSASAPTAAR